MQQQSLDNWCWAANAASIANFYDQAPTWTQCGVACDTLLRSDCCIPANPNPCNKPWYLESALTSTKNLAAPLSPSPLNQSQITAQIDAGLVIGARIGWSGGGGHFVTIYGYNSTDAAFYLYIADPYYGNSIVILDNFTTNYQGAGTWTHSYFTKSTAAATGGMIQFTAINENIIGQANLIKESLDLNNKRLLTSNQSATALLTSPHDVYNVSFDSLKSNDPQITKEGFRVMDSSSRQQKILSFNENTDAARLQQVIHSGAFNQRYEEIFERLLESQQANPTLYELRIIRQPELKVEAFWLHSEDNRDLDRFTPVLSPSFFTVNDTYNWGSFFSILTTAAERRVTYTDDRLGG